MGQAANLRAVEACTTRLRLVLNDPNLIDEPALTALGSRGVLRIGDGAVQVVVGSHRRSARFGNPRAMARSAQSSGTRHASSGAPIRKAPAPDRPTLEAVLAALGGRRNITGVHANSSRLAIGVHDPAVVDEPALGRLVRRLHARRRPACI